MEPPDISHILRERLIEALLADGVPAELAEEEADQLIAHSREIGQRMRAVRDSA